MIEVKNLKASYFSKRGEVQAVDNVDLEIFDNEILGIAGESGCGKSTLLKILYGCVEPPLQIISGSINYRYPNQKGQSITLGLKEIQKAWWQDISYIPQGSMNVLNPVARIESQFMDVVTQVNTRKSKSGLRQLIVNYLHDLDLPEEMLRAYPHQLSGGMRQRVIIALATFLNPKIILADEPTTAVDVVIQRGILTLLTKLQKEHKNTLVFVSHDMGVHYQISDRLAVMYAGKIVEIGSTDEIFEHASHPYPAMLIRALPRIGDREIREGISGAPPGLINPSKGCRFAPRCPHVMEICQEEEPRFVKIDTGHFTACHLIGEAEDPRGRLS
jgi:peptide/nickel transport system ATP-binding protein